MVSRKLISGLSLIIVIAMIGPSLCCDATVAVEPEEAVPEYNLYFGDLHSHTSYSDGVLMPDDAFEAGESAGADFLAVTDHQHELTDREWADILRSAEEHTEDNKFVAMAGYEYYLRGINELNIYGTPIMPPNPGIPPPSKYEGDRMTGGSFIPWIYDWIAEESGAIGQWNHPLSYGCPVAWDYFQFDYWANDRDLAMGMLECYNWGYREPSYIKALDNGWHMMPTATEDDHYGDWISPLGIRTVLLAPSLTTDNLYEAMREGRGYATLDDNLEIRFTVNDGVMGSNLSSPGATSYTASIVIDDFDGLCDAITLVEIVSDGNDTVWSYAPMSSSYENLNIELSGDDAPRYFFVRVTTVSPLNGDVEGVTAWTAPVWTGN